MRICQSIFVALVAALCACAGLAHARPPVELGGKLLLTRGISSVDGAGGGGLTPWALITGNATDRGVGGSAFWGRATLPDFTVTARGVAIGAYERLEFSLAEQELDTGATGVALGLGEGFTFSQQIIGVKVRVTGDAVTDQDRLLPQLAVGVLQKSADHRSLLSLLGAEDADGTEVYLAATKIFLGPGLVLSSTLRHTAANQNGLLGFGGGEGARVHAEASAGLLLSRRLMVGVEYRDKPDRLAFAREDDWADAFIVFAPSHNVTLTAAYADLGSMAGFDDQRGAYLMVQGGF